MAENDELSVVRVMASDQRAVALLAEENKWLRHLVMSMAKPYDKEFEKRVRDIIDKWNEERT